MCYLHMNLYHVTFLCIRTLVRILDSFINFWSNLLNYPAILCQFWQLVPNEGWALSVLYSRIIMINTGYWLETILVRLKLFCCLLSLEFSMFDFCEIILWGSLEEICLRLFLYIWGWVGCLYFEVGEVWCKTFWHYS